MTNPSMENELVQVRALVFEPYTLFRVRPMTGRYVNVSAEGYRLGRILRPWPPDPSTANIFLFGGSTAFGYGVADSETISSHLEKRIGAAVYNFATPNYTSTQERIGLEQLLLRGQRPDIAVFIDGFSDFIAPFYEPLMMAPFVEATTRGSLLGRLLRRNKRPDCRVPDAAVVVERYIANMRIIRAVCDEFQARPLFIWQPVPCYQYDGPSAGHGDSTALIECVQRGYKILDGRRAGGEMPGDFLWLADMQIGRRDALYLDADHYTAAFSSEIAARIAKHLADKGLIRS
jgi:hypothetical protein